MKKIFYAVVAVVAMASCSKDEVIEVNREQIGFGDVFVDNATRADYSTAGSLKEFYVYGTASGTMNGGGTVNIFDGDKVTGTVGNTVWSCTETQYWIPGANYNFAAVVDATVTAPDSSYGMPTTLTTIADDASTGNMNLKDMLYAEASVAGTVVTDNYNEPVNFTFNHLLSKVHFTVTSTAQGDYYHTVTGIKVANYSSGTYAITTDTWTGKTAKDVPFADIAEVTNTAGKSNADMLLMPTAATFNVMFTVNLYKDNLYKDDTLLSTENKTVPVTIKDGEQVVGLQKGHAYNFTIACSVGNPIQFSVTNNPAWATPQQEVTIP